MLSKQERQKQWTLNAVREESGAAVLETILISVVLLSLFAGAVDIGRMYFSYIIVTNAAREGARMAARMPCNEFNDEDVRALIIATAEQETEALPEFPQPGDVTISVEPDPVIDGCYLSGDDVIVTVEYTYNNFLTNLVGEGFPMSNSVTMVAFGNDQQ